VQEPIKSAPWLLTVDYYLEELSFIIEHFGLMEYYLYGSSWGTIIAQEWAVRQPPGLYGIMLDGALSDPQLYIHTQRRDRISTLPSFTQQLLISLLNRQDFQNPAYHILDETLNKFFVCRQIPWPDAMYECIEGMDRHIYSQMQGDCEFMIGGVLENWSINDRLHLVQVPTLVMAGEYDTMTEECSNAIVERVSTAWPLVKIPRAGHCKLMDEPFYCLDVMKKFLNTIEFARKLTPRNL
jgi:L-proline amide hydrolase